MNSKEFKKLEVERLMLLFNGNFNVLTSQYDPSDVYLETDTKLAIIAEYKSRYMTVDKYAKEGYVLEAGKVKRLFEKAKAAKEKCLNPVVYYINYFVESGVTLIWNLTKLFAAGTLKPSIGYFNATTASDFRNAGVKVAKSVYYLKPDTAKQIKDEQ